MGYDNKGTGLKIALAAVSVALVISIIVNFYFLTEKYGVTPDGGSEGQIAELQNEIESLKAAKLVTKLGASDEKPWLATDYLRVTGSVWNVGTNAAYNCRLHVILYQGQTIAKDTYINLGTINGESFTEVNENVYYEGSALSDWSITPEWE